MTQPPLPTSSPAIDGGRLGGKKIIRGCAEVNIHWLLTNGKLGKCVLHGNIGGSGVLSQPVIDQLSAAISAAWVAHLQLYAHPTAGLSGTSVRDLRLADQADIPGSAPSVVGVSTGDALPPETALVVTLRTLLAGRANRGRVYLPNWTGTALSAPGTALQAAADAAVAFITDVRTALGTASMPLCIGHVARAEYIGRTGTHHDARIDGTVGVITHEVRDRVFDSQRRRSQT